MSRTTDGAPEPVRRDDASAAVEPHGWRYVLGALLTRVPAASFADAATAAGHVAAACGGSADGHLRVDLRPGGAVLRLQSVAATGATAADLELAVRISSALRGAGFETVPEGAGGAAQEIEIAVDALDVAAVRPFWKAVTGYVGEAGVDGPRSPLVDPLGRGPSVWFQQMDAPRPQRNRLHLDVSVPPEVAAARIAAALAAGGVLVSDAEAPAFWVLADVEGNEVCITTWQGRDP